MRTIKFRAKRPDDGKWVFGDLKHHQKVTRTGLEPTILVDNDPIILETIGQFTGLLDKNDKEIYEGDILKCYLNRESYILVLVYYWEGGFMTNRINCIDKFYNRLSYYSVNEIKIEVIGNIHDTPELLKGDKK